MFLVYLAIISKVLSCLMINSYGQVHNIHDHFKISFISTLDAINIDLGIYDDPKEIKLVNNLTKQER